MHQNFSDHSSPHSESHDSRRGSIEAPAGYGLSQPSERPGDGNFTQQPFCPQTTPNSLTPPAHNLPVLQVNIGPGHTLPFPGPTGHTIPFPAQQSSIRSISSRVSEHFMGTGGVGASPHAGNLQFQQTAYESPPHLSPPQGFGQHLQPAPMPTMVTGHGLPFGQFSMQGAHGLPFGTVQSAIHGLPVIREGQSEVLPSIGSAGHRDGTCKKCCFFAKHRCGNGYNCEFCHYPHEKRARKSKPGKNRNSKKARKDIYRQGNEAARQPSG